MYRHRAARLLIGVLVTTALVSCTADGPSQSAAEPEVSSHKLAPPNEHTLAPPNDDRDIGLSKELAAARAAELGIDDPPNVLPIREITPDASGLRVKTQCMIDRGYPYEFDDPSGESVSIDMNGIDEEQFNIDSYICELQYPVEKRFQRDLGEREWRILHDHYVKSYIPCVEALGYVVEPFPSFDVYFSRIQGGELPYTPALEVGPQVQQDVMMGKYPSVDEFNRSVCSDTVDLDLLYPPG